MNTYEYHHIHKFFEKISYECAKNPMNITIFISFLSMNMKGYYIVGTPASNSLSNPRQLPAN